MGNISGKRECTAEELAAAKVFVDDTIAANKVVLFGKDWSPYSFKGKKALGTLLKPDEWVLISINGRPDMSPIQDVLLTMTGARTVPRVFVCGACIGGGNETKAMAESGELKKLLIEKGVLAA